MNQDKIVLKLLQKNKPLTSWQVFEGYGITRLSAIIFKLKKSGFKIETKTKTEKNRYGKKVSFAVYSLK